MQGVLTRKDVTPDHLKACLEALDETEKQRIQGYYSRSHRSRRLSHSGTFEDIEKSLLTIVDNA